MSELNQYNIFARNWRDHLSLKPRFYWAARLDAARKVYNFLAAEGWFPPSTLTDEDMARIIGDKVEE